MRQNTGQKVTDRLLEARQEALSQFKEGTIRPHGKLWGMDVFSWANPNPELVASTIDSFPFPVTWIGEKELFDWVAENHAEIWASIETVVSYNSPGLYLTAEHFKIIRTVVGAQNVKDALTLFNGIHGKSGVLLFTSSGPEWERINNEFTAFVKMHQ